MDQQRGTPSAATHNLYGSAHSSLATGRATRRRSSRRTRQGARLVLTPELSICGHPAEDSLLLRSAFLAACDDAVKTVARERAGLKDQRHTAPAGSASGSFGKVWRYPMMGKFHA